jgi:hypothetical protein
MRLVALVAVIAITLGIVATAVERGPLPSVELTARDGAVLRADTVARDGKWVIFYVHTGCRSCEAVLAALDGLEPGVGARVTIVAHAKDADELANIAARYPRLADVQWLGDATGALGERVAPQVAAAVVGLQGSMVEWSVNGIVTDPTQVTSLVAAWLGR